MNFWLGSEISAPLKKYSGAKFLSRIPMYMQDWIARLDDFLRMASRDILSHAGKISHEEALDKAKIEYAKYQQQVIDAPSLVEQHFLATIKECEKAVLIKSSTVIDN